MGKNKDQLLAEAAELGVEVPEGATNRQIKALIAAAPPEPEVEPVEAAESPDVEPARDVMTARRPRRATPRLPADLHR